jgi:hypothetical protein
VARIDAGLSRVGIGAQLRPEPNSASAITASVTMIWRIGWYRMARWYTAGVPCACVQAMACSRSDHFFFAGVYT